VDQVLAAAIAEKDKEMLVGLSSGYFTHERQRGKVLSDGSI
jgi:hypothetical protein